MVQSMRLASIISRSMSLPLEIRVVAQVWGVEIGIWFIPQTEKIGVHLLMIRIGKIVSNVDNHLNYGRSSINMAHVGKIF